MSEASCEGQCLGISVGRDRTPVNERSAAILLSVDDGRLASQMPIIVKKLQVAGELSAVRSVDGARMSPKFGLRRAAMESGSPA